MFQFSSNHSSAGRMLPFLCVVYFMLFGIKADQVLVHDLTADEYKRNLDGGLPEVTRFKVNYGGEEISLNFRENKGLNADAAMYEAFTDPLGKVRARRLVGKGRYPHSRFYQDEANSAYVVITCERNEYGPCTRTLRGNLLVRGTEYSLQPDTTSTDRRTVNHGQTGTPHIMEKLEPVFTRNMDGESRATDYVLPPNLLVSEKDEIEDSSDEECAEMSQIELAKELQILDKLIKEMKASDGHDAKTAMKSHTDRRTFSGLRGVSDKLVPTKTDSEKQDTIDFVVPTKDTDSKEDETDDSIDEENNKMSELDLAKELQMLEELNKEMKDSHRHDAKTAMKSHTDRRTLSGLRGVSDKLVPSKTDTENQDTIDYVVPPKDTDDNKKSSTEVGGEKEKEDESNQILQSEGRALLESILARLKRINRDKREATLFTVELLVVIDYPAYVRFENFASGNVEYAIREYVSHIINGVDLRYRSIEDPDYSFRVAIAGFVIATGEAESPWSGAPGESGVSFLDAMQRLAAWRADQPPGELPEHDHALLLTGNDLQYGGSKHVVGLAYLGGICLEQYAVSASEMGGFFFSSGTLAHELGHNLGMPHDAEADGCDPNQAFLMAPSFSGDLRGTDSIHPWRFSRCSIEALKFTANRQGRRCLLDEGSVWDEQEWNEHTDELPGEHYTLDEQCHFIAGSGSSFSQGLENTPEMCRDFRCQGGSTGFYIAVAAPGTPCGTEKWCIDGLCVLKQTSSGSDGNADGGGGSSSGDSGSANDNGGSANDNGGSADDNGGSADDNGGSTDDNGENTNDNGDEANENGGNTNSNGGSANGDDIDSNDGSTNSDGGSSQCVDVADIAGVTCSELQELLGQKMCKFYSLVCCATCRSSCTRDRKIKGVVRYRCQDLMATLGESVVCQVFPYHCCMSCMGVK